MPAIAPAHVLGALEGPLYCAVLTLLFVGSLYVFPGALSLNRNHPSVIWRRFMAVGVACVACPLFVYVQPHGHGASASTPFWAWISFRTDTLLPATVGPLLAFVLLFLGPLLLLALDDLLPFQADFPAAQVAAQFRSLIVWRDLVVGPIAEEIVFRACMTPLLWASGYARGTIVLIQPLFFGIAHLHQGYALYRQYGRTADAVRIAVRSMLFQFAYTTVFGWMATFVLLRTNSVWATIVVHAFCNAMGFPDADEVAEHPKRRMLVVVHVAGFVGFLRTVWTLTSPRLFRSIYWGYAAP
ncbi:hypothetical protein CXG81DRAFT_10787 [Caulochytrium protostelioides]|uniref:intramembrane prenyl-peptidase Rce1 n=1 Tax=Caulochytrium protostelioides TaxID=1555241 RepID=A0A4P9XAP4_9FUNG|nr:hypothetical protein CXG81DRAFT_10787 [Caulochytrium protostelioides]|eukprot:RKP02412.1 hypothetical protein CXG81DRAFT_10787 [Caulochytrium protostelioides]